MSRVEPTSSRRLFRGSELPRLLILAALMLVGWGLVWQFAHQRPQPAEPVAKADPAPAPVVPDKSDVFESVTDRTAMSFRDNAAYAYLLDKARQQLPSDLARQSRRDILLTHLWERPELYRGVPVHLLGTALRVLRFESKLSQTGWLYEAWIVTPDATRYPYSCVFEEVPEGFPLGPNVSERVVFNGYFLKIMKYQAGDVPRGAPVLVGKLGWEASPPAAAPMAAAPGRKAPLSWVLPVLGALFLISLGRWIYQLSHYLSAPRSRHAVTRPTEDLPEGKLEAWVESLNPGIAEEEESES
jgi:hypothetical protein